MSDVARRIGSRFRSRVPLVIFLALATISGTGVSLLIDSANAGAAPTSHVGPEGVIVYNVPNLAPATTPPGGKTVDGISCRKLANETVKYHVHVHVAIYVNGKMERLPAGIGITKPRLLEKFAKGHFYDVGLYNCLYWLHTHVADGIVHVESPGRKTFTLGDFFDVWNQPLSLSQVGPAKGKVVVFENGKRLVGNPRSTPLLPHADIQIDIGSPVVKFQTFHFKVTGGCGEGTTSCSAPTTSTTAQG
jgi:hypothetical protein